MPYITNPELEAWESWDLWRQRWASFPLVRGPYQKLVYQLIQAQMEEAYAVYLAVKRHPSP